MAAAHATAFVRASVNFVLVWVGLSINPAAPVLVNCVAVPVGKRQIHGLAVVATVAKGESVAALAGFFGGCPDVEKQTQEEAEEEEGAVKPRQRKHVSLGAIRRWCCSKQAEVHEQLNGKDLPLFMYASAAAKSDAYFWYGRFALSIKSGRLISKNRPL